MNFVETLAQKIGAGLNLDPDHIAAAIVAALKSIRVTAYALAMGLTVDAVMSAHQYTVLGVLSYWQAHWIAWLVANVLAPAWRATSAYKAAAAGAPPGA
jgi:hypothetical protein